MTSRDIFLLANKKFKNDRSKQEIFEELVKETGASEREVLRVIKHMPSSKVRKENETRRSWNIFLLLIMVGFQWYHYQSGNLYISTGWLIFTLIIIPFHFIGMYGFNGVFYLSAAVFSGIIGYNLLSRGFRNFEVIHYLEFAVSMLLLISSTRMRLKLTGKYRKETIPTEALGKDVKVNYKIVFEE